MKPGTQYVVYAPEDLARVEKKIRKRERRGASFIFDKRSGASPADTAPFDLEAEAGKLARADSVLFFESRNSQNNKDCQAILALARQKGLKINVISLGGKLFSFIAAFVLIGIFYYVVSDALFPSVPNTIGFDAVEAARRLDDSGFHGIFRYSYSDEVPAGIIQKQYALKKSPPAVPVILVESLGPAESLTEVPDICGRTIEDAVRLFTDAGFSGFRITSEANAPGAPAPGTVLGQNIPAGSRVSTASSIGLRVSAGTDPVIFRNGSNEYTLPADNGTVTEIDTVSGNAVSTGSYEEKTYADAVHINVRAGDMTNFGGVYDKPVIISGENGALVLFLGHTVFNDDVILRTDGEAVAVFIEKNSEINGKLIIDNNIMHAEDHAFLPTFFISDPVSAEVVHGSGGCIMNSREPLEFNGKTYTFDPALDFADMSAYAGKFKNLVLSDSDPNTHIVYLRRKHGSSAIEHTAACMRVEY